MKTLFARFVREDQGQDLIEYVLLGSLIALAVTVGVGALGTNINAWYNGVAGWVTTMTALVP
jgi:pilus assembly protein Flp/PilA